MPNGKVLYLQALTGLHPGCGTSLSFVDLPVQRERHTGWPVIPGSSLKGVLRDACRRTVSAEENLTLREADNSAAITFVFGPAQVKADEATAGALSITDARILAFPVRSACGVFALVTCPAALARFNRDRTLAGQQALPPVPSFAPNERGAYCPVHTPLLSGKIGRLVFEEFDFELSGEDDDLAGALAQAITTDEATAQEIATRLCVIPDDDFTHFVRYATEIVARVGLDYETKTVNEGALFYQEVLPPETIFYALVLESGVKPANGGASAPDPLTFLSEKSGQFLQVGGDSTIGRGFCAVCFR